MSRPVKLVLDANDPDRLAAFWAAALDYTILGAVENYILLAPDDGNGPQLQIQKVAEPKAGKNRMHIDLTCSVIGGEVERLEALGATRSSDTVAEHGMSWVVMADPEGNEFCVCDGGNGN